jgi:hypothetical protein
MDRAQEHRSNRVNRVRRHSIDRLEPATLFVNGLP